MLCVNDALKLMLIQPVLRWRKRRLKLRFNDCKTTSRKRRLSRLQTRSMLCVVQVDLNIALERSILSNENNRTPSLARTGHCSRFYDPGPGFTTSLPESDEMTASPENIRTYILIIVAIDFALNVSIYHLLRYTKWFCLFAYYTVLSRRYKYGESQVEGKCPNHSNI